MPFFVSFLAGLPRVRRRWRAGVAALAWLALPAWALPTFNEVRTGFRSSETLVLSREGEVVQRVRTDASVRRGQWQALADMSPALRQALVLSEDKRFFEHSGVDWRAARWRRYAGAAAPRPLAKGSGCPTGGNLRELHQKWAGRLLYLRKQLSKMKQTVAVPRAAAAVSQGPARAAVGLSGARPAGRHLA